jgi:hypothetical protein
VRWFAFTLTVVVVACGTRERSEQFDPSAATAAIRSALPPKWNLAETVVGELPFGHYWGDWSRGYSGRRGQRVTVTGPTPVMLVWTDDAGRQHQDAMAVESIDLWVMPPEYRNEWRTFINPEAPVPPALVKGGNRWRVYGAPSHRLTISREAFDRFIRSGQPAETRWPDSPHNKPERISWRTWKADLRRALS